jgi:hypothetical protein
MRIIKVYYCNDCPYMIGFDFGEDCPVDKETAYCAYKRMTQKPYTAEDMELGHFKRIGVYDSKHNHPTEPLIEIPSKCPL